jgi:uncharacterized FlaG/YvyC family protein
LAHRKAFSSGTSSGKAEGSGELEKPRDYGQELAEYSEQINELGKTIQVHLTCFVYSAKRAYSL